MLLDAAGDDVSIFFDSLDGKDFIISHQKAVTFYIGAEDRSKFAGCFFFCHGVTFNNDLIDGEDSLTVKSRSEWIFRREIVDFRPNLAQFSTLL
jgi:hypothetical protein